MRTSFVETLARPDPHRAKLGCSSLQGAAVPMRRLHLPMQLPSPPQPAGPSKQQITGLGAFFWSLVQFARGDARAPEPVVAASTAHSTLPTYRSQVLGLR